MISTTQLRERLQTLQADLDGRLTSIWLTPLLLDFVVQATLGANGDVILTDAATTFELLEREAAEHGICVTIADAQAISAEHGCDMLKVAGAVWICRRVTPSDVLADALAGLEQAMVTLLAKRAMAAGAVD
ncbi:MAG TPA: hypothetical protein VIH71_07610 [Solirubrobacteraceae bacterium]